MPACLGDMGHQAVYLKTRAQLFNRRKSRNTKLKALRCLQVNTYFGRMKHWAATQSSSSTADASIDNDERYAYRDGGVEVVGGESDQTVGVSRPGDLVTRSATTDVEMAAAAGDVRCDVPAVVDMDSWPGQLARRLARSSCALPRTTALLPKPKISLSRWCLFLSQ